MIDAETRKNPLSKLAYETMDQTLRRSTQRRPAKDLGYRRSSDLENTRLDQKRQPRCGALLS